MTDNLIDPKPLTKRSITVEGKTMAFHESGEGPTILFLHGNPTSSYLWRNIIPHLQHMGRCIAPDLIGTGDFEPFQESDRDDYRFVGHRRHLDALLEHLNIGDDVTLVLHDWGSALGFDWANRHRDRVKQIVYMEAIVAPISLATLDQGIRRVFEGFRSPVGETLIIEKNIFIERMLRGAVKRGLSETEMAEYRKPYLEPERRHPMLIWPRELPVDGSPQDVAAIIESYGAWLNGSPVPKLFINAEPGSMLVGPQREFCRSWANQEEVSVSGLHFLQEDSPHEIGTAISAWMSRSGLD